VPQHQTIANCKNYEINQSLNLNQPKYKLFAYMRISVLALFQIYFYNEYLNERCLFIKYIYGGVWT